MNEHDYTSQRWGWHCEVWKNDPSQDPATHPTKFTGHGHGLREGHIILMPMTSGKVGRWRITNLRYQADPPDMWWADAVLDGYRT